MSKRRSIVIFRYLLIIILSFTVLVPFWNMIINSFKTMDEAAIPSLNLPTEWQIVENYEVVIEKGGFVRSFFNSVLITFSSSIIILIVSTMAAFVFGRRAERRIRFVFYLFLMGIIVPPSFILSTLLLKYINLLGTYQGIILYYVANFSPLPILILTGFMSTIPKEIEEAAIADGASSFRIFFGITLPLLRPAIATSFIYSVLKIWNDFIFPLYLLAGDTKKYTMILGLYSFKGQFYTAWNLVFADIFLVSIPVIITFLLAQRQIVEGLTAGSVKG